MSVCPRAGMTLAHIDLGSRRCVCVCERIFIRVCVHLVVRVFDQTSCVDVRVLYMYE